MQRSEFSFFSIRRKGNQLNLNILVVFAVVAAFTFLSYYGLGRVGDAALADPAGPASPAGAAIATWRITLTALGGVACALTMLLFVRSLAVGLRAVALEVWIRRMGAGDLDYKVEIEGNDELTALAISLEELRRRSINVVRLQLVEQLAEELRRKNEELERALADLLRTQDQIVAGQKLTELGALTSGVAHELRNPLNFIENFCESSAELLDELMDALSEGRGDVDDIKQELTDNMERVRVHSERADRVVDDMLTLGRGNGQFQPIDVNDLVNRHAVLAYNTARSLDDDFRLEVHEEFDPDVGIVSVVPENMARVVLNMVSNACYATNEKRCALAESSVPYTPTLWLKTRRKDEAIEISIRDNGTGIPPEVIDKIFNPFFTTKTTNAGTGLGLSQSSDIVRHHGGQIIPRSKPGEYTEMIVSIPATPPPETEP